MAEEKNFSSTGIEILCDAAQDPDFYEFGTLAAHAQTPDEVDFCDSDTVTRNLIIEKAIGDYVDWVSIQFRRCTSALEKGAVRLSLYWLGYALHGVEDLAVHKGITNGEHASTSENPDFQAVDVALSFSYARRLLDTVYNALGQKRFDYLRNHSGGGLLTIFEKNQADIHPEGWDLNNRYGEYKAAGEKYININPPPEPVRWDREYVGKYFLPIFTQSKNR